VVAVALVRRVLAVLAVLVVEVLEGSIRLVVATEPQTQAQVGVVLRQPPRWEATVVPVL
jgi:hypothetical protein